jgi:superfamily I DNA/RNA helicase
VPEREAFWIEPRVALLLAAAGRFLGIAGISDPESAIEVPDRILARGPRGLAAYLEDIQPFDCLFWQSPQFRELEKGFAEHGGWAGLLNWVHLRSEIDQVRARAEKVQILTLHAAKGLEFEAVFLPALEDGILPFAGPEFLAGQGGPEEVLAPEAVAEERRLLYVGLTRARSRLYLSHAARREIFGRELRLQPSRFLAELPQAGLTRSRLVGRTVETARQLGLLA